MLPYTTGIARPRCAERLPSRISKIAVSTVSGGGRAMVYRLNLMPPTHVRLHRPSPRERRCRPRHRAHRFKVSSIFAGRSWSSGRWSCSRGNSSVPRGVFQLCGPPACRRSRVGSGRVGSGRVGLSPHLTLSLTLSRCSMQNSWSENRWNTRLRSTLAALPVQ